MLILERVVLGVGILLVLAAIFCMWQLRSEMKKSEQEISESDGVIPAIASRACNCFLSVSVGYFLIFQTILLFFRKLLPDWEAAEAILMYVRVLGIFWMLVALGLYYYSRAGRIEYDKEKIVVRKPFKAGEEIPWRDLGRMELQATYCVLYDRNGQERLRVSSGNDHFCRLARAKVEGCFGCTSTAGAFLN